MSTHDYEVPPGIKFKHINLLGEYLIVESSKLSQTLDYIKENGPVQLYLNWQLGFNFKDLSFLKGIELLVDGLMIVVEKFDLNGLEKLINLRHLHFSDEQEQEIRFESFLHLVYCSIQWNKIYNHAVFPYSLTKLNVRMYNPEHGFNEASLNNFRNITELVLNESSIRDLSILCHFGSLKKLNVVNCRKLEDISGLSAVCESLIHLEVAKCRNIASFSSIAENTKLQWLNLSDCGSIPSLSFIQNLPILDHFVFLGTTVTDGDLSYLKGIRQVAFNNKSHYSLKMNDFK
jgi:hypothetical protein